LTGASCQDHLDKNESAESTDGKLLARVTGGWMKAERQRDTLPKSS
jgi:hypothetical protein